MTRRGRGRATVSLSRVAVVLAVVATVAVVVPTGGYTSVEADRGLEVEVAPDSSALVGYEAECEGDHFAVTVTNRLSSGAMDGTVTANGTAKQLSVASAGDSDTVAFDEAIQHDDPVVVAVGAGRTRATLHRSVPCDLPAAQ